MDEHDRQVVKTLKLAEFPEDDRDLAGVILVSCDRRGNVTRAARRGRKPLSSAKQAYGEVTL